MNTPEYIKSLQDRASAVLESRLNFTSHSERLVNAIHYAVHGGGKRIRPLLCYASAEAVGGTLDKADDCACAVELIHAYSLVHDDLPAMDNDELRRGQPTSHIKFDEATAILAGDALQSLAFELLANAGKIDPSSSLEMIRILSEAAGWKGMVAGQSLDIESAGKIKNEKDLALMHRLKTGALITASVKMGAISTGLASTTSLAQLETFATCMGLAFQIKDDILDVEGETEVLGKQQGQDQSLNKPTYPAILGLEEARKRMLALFEEGTQALDSFGMNAEKLKGIASYIIERRH